MIHIPLDKAWIVVILVYICLDGAADTGTLFTESLLFGKPFDFYKAVARCILGVIEMVVAFVLLLLVLR